MRNLRYPNVNESSTSAKIEQIVSFLRQLVAELNLEDNGSAEKGRSKGWTYIKKTDGTCEAYGDFTVTAKTVVQSENVYMSEEILVPFPMECRGAVVGGNADGGVTVVPSKATATNAVLRIISFYSFSSGAKFNVRLHMSAFV